MFKNFRALEFLQRKFLRIEFPRLKLPFLHRFVKFFCALNSVVKWLLITIWVVFTLFLFAALALLLIGVGSEIAQYLLRTLL